MNTVETYSQADGKFLSGVTSFFKDNSKEVLGLVTGIINNVGNKQNNNSGGSSSTSSSGSNNQNNGYNSGYNDLKRNDDDDKKSDDKFLGMPKPIGYTVVGLGTAVVVGVAVKLIFFSN